MNARPVRAMPDSVSAQRSRSPADGTNGSVTASRRARAPARRRRVSVRCGRRARPRAPWRGAAERRRGSRAPLAQLPSVVGIDLRGVDLRPLDERVEVGELAARPTRPGRPRARRPTRAGRLPPAEPRVVVRAVVSSRRARHGLEQVGAPDRALHDDRLRRVHRTAAARAARRRGPRGARRVRRPPARAPDSGRRRRGPRPPRPPARSRMTYNTSCLLDRRPFRFSVGGVTGCSPQSNVTWLVSREQRGAQRVDRQRVGDLLAEAVAQVEHVDDTVARRRHDRLRHVEVEIGEHRRDAREQPDVVGRVHLDHGRERRRVEVDDARGRRASDASTAVGPVPPGALAQLLVERDARPTSAPSSVVARSDRVRRRRRGGRSGRCR